jgi:biopolymer transport protein TolQ
MMHVIATNAFFSAYSQADFFGKLIFITLFSLSALCWIVLVQKILETRKVKRIASAFVEACEKNRERILHVDISPEDHPFATVFKAVKEKTLELLGKNHFFAQDKEKVHLSRADLELVESYVLTTISQENKQLEKHLFILSTIVTLAPFLGLLGTVWGILVTFSELHGGVAAGSNAAILAGLSTALATTVLGLVIAIPALVAHNYLKSMTRTLSSDMEDFLYKLLATIEVQYRKADL